MPFVELNQLAIKNQPTTGNPSHSFLQETL
jgi:hypothetical protein